MVGHSVVYCENCNSPVYKSMITAAGFCKSCQGDQERFDAGRDTERAVIVAWLQTKAANMLAGGLGREFAALNLAAERLYIGEHLKGEK